ncbi:invasion associated locus B family protein [uncultured Roseobacter sp.]|uniref:invasion associated locus B family protein n=1 Tax=uncultured Roseobacter sp. TaxID=114847 RepID=UPI00261E292F|nr:invasion associated locus B family protein [uncultured Roseobacter sp.]
MPDFSKILTGFGAVALPLVLSAGLAAAQSTDEEAAEAPVTDDGLSLGTAAEPQVGQAYAAEFNGDWELRCVKTESGEDPCQMVQLLTDPEGAPIAEFSLYRLAEENPAAAGATVIVPLETALQAQLTIQVDSQQAKRYPYAFCNQVGCYARIGLTEEDVASYKRGNQAVLSIVPMAAQDQRVTVTLSLSGFTASFDKTSVSNR